MRRRWLNLAMVVLAASLLGLGAWGLRLWLTYPRAPDPTTAELDVAIGYMANPEFGRLFESHQRDYALAVVDRMREKSFDQLLMMALDQTQMEIRRQVAQNLRKLKNHEEIGGRMMGIFLDKFYELPELKRTVYMTTLVLADQARGDEARRREHGGEWPPTLDRFKKDFARFLENQSPRLQAQMSQFMVDISRRREAMGIKDPFDRARERAGG